MAAHPLSFDHVHLVSTEPDAAAEWYVAINDVPVGPIKRDEVARKIGLGAVTAALVTMKRRPSTPAEAEAEAAG